ncbi:HNH endonuclease signature motif containing protein [Mesorhizobium sp.]|uniref:HNH endonuclease n=2 Tax=Mesorhizobium sp. TaxID=1871066 RepID=UPI000FE8A49B|nr:HNH endonuclease signature motif containing protein [Mesorhizobium sp.]RWO78448.1 MAG: HNH endonuclease [Mesorhizobium sp.]
MRILPCPSRDEAQAYLVRAIETYVHAGIPRGYSATEAEIESVLAIYDSYDASLGAPAEALKGAGLLQQFRDAIYSGYDFTQVGGKLASVRASLMAGVELCPICGIAPPRQLDHHLPRSDYHPLAVYPRNLVPLCQECNQSKSKSAAEEPAQQFFHPYLEAIPDTPFLRAGVAIEGGGLVATFDIDPDAPIEALVSSRLSYVLQRLKLNERYAREINIYLTSQATAVRILFDSAGAEGVRNYLLAQADVESREFHLNHWRPVLLRALAAHAGFCGGEFAEVLPA